MLRLGRMFALAAVVAFTAGGSNVRADEEPSVTGKLAKLKLSGVGWATYRYQLSDRTDRDAYGGSKPGTDDYVSRQPLNGKDMNQFDVDRVYLTADYALDERFDWQTQVEMNNLGGKLDLWMKRAYVKVKNPLGLDHTHARMGQIGHVFTSEQEQAWGFRSVSAIPADRYLGVSTTWLGLGFGGAVGDGLLDYDLAVTNEKSHRRINESKYKTFMGRVTIAPLAGSEGAARGIRFVAFAQWNTENPPAGFTPGAADNQNLWFDIAPCYLSERITAGLEFAQKRDKTPRLESGGGPPEKIVETKTSQVISGFARADLTERLRGFARFDLVDPNTDADDDGFTNLIAGLARSYVKGVRSIVDVEYTDYEARRSEDPDAQDDADLTVSARIEVSL